ncbi:MAG: HupE/UreJ family protein [Cyclobacteriaceae bacterium]
MSEFELFFGLGLDHILDIDGYDHILFVVALCAIYEAREWKKILILVTAFTIGHSITLAMATLKLVTLDAELIEFLIPVTIFVTALVNIFNRDHELTPKQVKQNYGLALGFGLIHGMGFSNYLRSLLGKDETIVNQLFAFNVGLEVGQIIIVVAFLILGVTLRTFFFLDRRDWVTIVSSAVMGVSITLMIETKFW